MFELNQVGLIDDIMKDNDIKECVAVTPANLNLYYVDSESSPLDKNGQKNFLSVLMKINYVVMTRPDLVPTVSFLCTRSGKANKDDLWKLQRLLRYMNLTRSRSLFISPASLDVLNVYCDASYAVHEDFRSQTGYILSFGSMHDLKSSDHGSFVACSSKKQRPVAKSSSEAELYSMNSAVDLALWLKQLLAELKIHLKEIQVFEDNKSTIAMIESGTMTKRSTHIGVRFFFIHDLITTGVLKVSYLPTDEQIADFFTKSLIGKKFRKFVHLLGIDNSSLK